MTNPPIYFCLDEITWDFSHEDTPKNISATTQKSNGSFFFFFVIFISLGSVIYHISDALLSHPKVTTSLITH